MSIEIGVFFESPKLPTRAAWAAAIRSHGFDLELDPELDPETSSGFRPCKLAGNDAGFEFFLDDTEDAELDDADLQRVGERDTMANFVTHSDMRELESSVMAAAALCVLTDGVLWDTEAGEFLAATEALEWARVNLASARKA